MKDVAAVLEREGLLLRGCLNFDDDEQRPVGPSGAPARAIILVGTAGGRYWQAFRRWLDRQPDVLANPLDTWSREIIANAASACGGRVIMPNDRPYQPFQQWAMRAEGLRPSPIGLLMHPRFGLWHAYRGAILLDQQVDASDVRKEIHHCDACDAKPCLSACPVGAYSMAGFAHERCLGHVRSGDGSICRDLGCVARNACPIGTAWRYPAAVQAFHQRAFSGA